MGFSSSLMSYRSFSIVVVIKVGVEVRVGVRAGFGIEFGFSVGVWII